MKRTGRHPDRALSAIKVRQERKPGRYADGNGLYLLVDSSGARRWLLRIVIKGKRCDLGLGSAGLVSLADAREKAANFRKVAREGGDPRVERQTEQQTIPTFADAAERVHAEHELGWKNPKHAQQWLNTLKQYVFPILGTRKVDEIDTPDVLRVLAPIWLTKPETARRVKQRIGTVMGWVKASGLRTGENPVEGVLRGLPKQSGQKEHHGALPFAEVPAFIRRLRRTESSAVAKLAFEFLIQTAARTSEVLLATWDEIDLDKAVWTVPPDRMKAKREHRVPLSLRCRAILVQARNVTSGKGYIFPGRDLAKPMSNMVFLATLKRMELSITAHGFRSAFRDWASETTGFPREVAEMALAHTIQNKVEAAYRRGDLFEKRCELMAAWSRYLKARF